MNTGMAIAIAAIAGIALVLAAAILIMEDARNDNGDAPDENGNGEEGTQENENENEEAPEGENAINGGNGATIEVTDAWAEPGDCRDGAVDTSHEQCHYIEVFVEAPEGTDVDVTMMSWRADDAEGERHTPVWVDEPMQVFQGSSRTVTLWFTLDTDTRLESVQHLDSGATLQVPDYGGGEPVDPTIGQTGTPGASGPS